MRQLEEHVGSCEFCRNALAERKAALQKMLGVTSPPAIAAISPEALQNDVLAEAFQALQNQAPAEPAVSEATAKKQAISQIKQAVRTTKDRAAETTRGSLIKPLLYTLALAIVLTGMSYAVKSGSAFGPRATDRVELQPVADSTTVGKPITNATTSLTKALNVGKALGNYIAPTEALIDVDTSTPEPKITTSSRADVEKAIAPIRPTHRRLTASRRTKRIQTRRPNHRPTVQLAKDTVQIYDGRGKVVTENQG